MSRTRERNHSATVVILVAAIVSACHSTTTSGPAASTTSAAFPYPPFEIRTDVAVPLDHPLTDAAQFALGMSVDNRLKNDPDNDSIKRRFRSHLSPGADITDAPPVPDNFTGATGGALHRAVGARQLPEDTVEVTICSYDTPGLYARSKSGELIGPDPKHPFSVERPLVQWTDRPAADGSAPNSPRWLWVGQTRTYDLTMEQIAAVCAPFKPEPFIQKMPDPIAPTPTQSR